MPVRGDDAYQVAVGPIHAGVIESGHFRFHVVGDRILHLDARLFYKHRGLERAAEGQHARRGLAYAARACAACAVANGVAYAHACEEALGLAPTRRARARAHDPARARAHVEPPQRHRGRLRRRRPRRRQQPLRRARPSARGGSTPRSPATASSSAPSASAAARSTLDATSSRAAREELAALRARRARGWRELLLQRARSRTGCPTIGVVAADDAERLGAVGPAARAAGLADDVRAREPAARLRRLRAASCRERAAGDVQARLEQRALELAQTFDAPRRACSTARVEPAAARAGATERSRSASAASRARAARRAASSSGDGDRIERLRLRTGSYANWPAVAHAAADNLLPDFPLINKSFELCYACADR